MASLIYNSAIRDALTGALDYDTDTFKVMLTNGYTPNKDTHTKRSDVTGEVTGTGYTAGGAATTTTVAAVDAANDDVEITTGAANWPTSTITADGAVIYKSRGGAASADELVCFVDFGGDIISTAGTFALTASVLKYQN